MVWDTRRSHTQFPDHWPAVCDGFTAVSAVGTVVQKDAVRWNKKMGCSVLRFTLAWWFQSVNKKHIRPMSVRCFCAGRVAEVLADTIQRGRSYEVHGKLIRYMKLDRALDLDWDKYVNSWVEKTEISVKAVVPYDAPTHKPPEPPRGAGVC